MIEKRKNDFPYLVRWVDSPIEYWQWESASFEKMQDFAFCKMCNECQFENWPIQHNLVLTKYYLLTCPFSQRVIGILFLTNRRNWGPWRGSVLWAVASNNRGLQFKSSHRQNNYIERLLSTVVIKTKIKKKRLGMALFEKIEAIRLPGPLIRPFKNSLFGLNSDLT